MSHEAVFGRIYARREWGDGETVSGPGSGLARTARVRTELEALVRELGVTRLLDAGCGDFNWLSAADLGGAEYIGVDVVPELLGRVRRLHGGRGRTFIHADVTRDDLPGADLILCREVLMHFPDEDVLAAVANLQRTGARWLLMTTFTERPHNNPIELGFWRPLNLQAAPFQFPPPLRTIDDAPLVDNELYRDKRLGLWELPILS